MNPWIGIAIGVVLTLATSVFVAAEFSFVALDRAAVERSATAGDARSGRVLAALRQLSTQLSVAQVGITLTTLAVGYLIEPSLSVLLDTPLSALGIPAGAVGPISIAAGLLIATAFSMVVGELIPQNLAVAEPLPTARFVAVPMWIFGAVFKPLVALLNGSANAFLHRFGVEPQEELSGARTPQELASMVRRSADRGSLDKGTAALITRTLDFREQTATDVMTPRPRCLFLESDAPVADLIAESRSSGLSRFPVIADSPDEVVGVAHLKSAIAVPFESRDTVPVSVITAPLVRVPETLQVEPLLLELRRSNIALVVDEYGGTAGVVTLEDVVEELVGEVNDEHDTTRGRARQLGDGSWTVPGLWRPDEFNEKTHAGVPEGPAYETLGGFLMQRLGRIPQEADEVRLQHGSLRVLRMDGRRVDLIRYTPNGNRP
jgi:CBS domain containing-hemolysin-like protein